MWAKEIHRVSWWFLLLCLIVFEKFRWLHTHERKASDDRRPERPFPLIAVWESGWGCITSHWRMWSVHPNRWIHSPNLKFLLFLFTFLFLFYWFEIRSYYIGQASPKVVMILPPTTPVCFECHHAQSLVTFSSQSLYLSLNYMRI